MALSELGRATVLEIARKSKLNRVSLYYILEKMKERGLLTTLTEKNTTYFVPTDPRLMAERAKQHARDLEASVTEFKALLNKTGHLPQVRFFEGLDGIKAVYEDTLHARTEILSYANSEDVRKYWPEYDAEYVARRAQKKIWLRGLAPDDAEGRRVKSEDPLFHRELRLVDRKKLPFNNEVNIYDDKVAFVSFAGEPFGVIIESKEMAGTQRSIFEMAWQFAGTH